MWNSWKDIHGGYLICSDAQTIAMALYCGAGMRTRNKRSTIAEKA